MPRILSTNTLRPRWASLSDSMRSMAIDRRRFLALAAAAGLAPGALRAASQAPLYLAARRSGERYEAVVLDAQGHDRQVVPMPARGHSFALDPARGRRSEEHTSELQSLMRISYAVFCLKKQQHKQSSQ